MTTDNTYQGWTNRETWCVALWLNNDERLQTEAQLICNLDNEMLQEAAQSLEEWFRDDIAPEREGFEHDLQQCTLARVNWLEIAEGFRIT